MGTAYASSKLANLVKKSPGWLKNWFLHGAYLKYPEALAIFYSLGSYIKYINTFPRFETVQVLRSQQSKYPDIELDLVDRIGFARTEGEVSAYVDHLIHNTYILCPRGSENFSFRVYETLKFGRVPVIIDTDMVLPKEINWEQLAIRVPYNSLAKIGGIIRDDYNSRSADDFIARQRAALTTMSELKSMRWMEDAMFEILH
jgi:hypothetical protein